MLVFCDPERSVVKIREHRLTEKRHLQTGKAECRSVPKRDDF